MSGGYKYADVGIDPTQGIYDLTSGCVILGAIVAQRAAQAAVEATRRLEAEESALRAGLNASKRDEIGTIEATRIHLVQSQSLIMESDYKALCQGITNAGDAVEAARTHTAMREALLGLARIDQDIQRAIFRKSVEDARAGKTPRMDVWRRHFQDLKRQAAGLGAPDDPGPLDPAAAAAIQTMLARVGGALQTSNQAVITAAFADLETLIGQQQELVLDYCQEQERRVAMGQQACSEASAIIVGIRADPIVMRWHAASIDTLSGSLEDVNKLVRSGNFEAALDVVKQMRPAAEQIVKEANAAQMKADQRDYIASSISNTLEEMGFVVGAAQAEHPGHPATASILHAASASGKQIAVSVPMEGQVWYHVDGYVKSVEGKVGGGEAVVCDEAEEVITQMHDALANEFHVQTGELMWEGKDPSRSLRAVKSLPADVGSTRNNGHR